MDGTARRFTDELARFAELSEEPPAAPGAKTGRHPLPPELQTYPFSLRLTPGERELVVIASRRIGSPAPATWARRALLEAARALLAAEADGV
jgi:hypothetical protein